MHFSFLSIYFFRLVIEKIWTWFSHISVVDTITNKLMFFIFQLSYKNICFLTSIKMHLSFSLYSIFLTGYSKDSDMISSYICNQHNYQQTDIFIFQLSHKDICFLTSGKIDLSFLSIQFSYWL